MKFVITYVDYTNPTGGSPLHAFAEIVEDVDVYHAVFNHLRLVEDEDGGASAIFALRRYLLSPNNDGVYVMPYILDEASGVYIIACLRDDPTQYCIPYRVQ